MFRRVQGVVVENASLSDTSTLDIRVERPLTRAARTTFVPVGGGSVHRKVHIARGQLDHRRSATAGSPD